MKKLILLCATVVFTMSTSAQVWDNAKPDKTFTFGVRAGVNFSSFSGDFEKGYGSWGYASDYVGKKGKIGFHAGVVVDYNIIKSFAIETGLFYSVKGCKASDDVPDYAKEYFSSIEDSLKLSYIQLPLLALFRFHVGNETHIQLKAGGYVAKRLGSDNPPFCLAADRESSNYYYTEYCTYKGWDAGIIAGAGISFKRIYLGVQYELGLCKLMSFHDVKNQNLAISVGYDF